MSQHSDELIEHDPEKLERCAEAMYRAMQFDCGGTLRVRHRRWARAVLDEAAKPAPGGPKTREGWQPIETAPKDGRDFLVWNRENRVRKARWYERSSSDLGISLYEGDGVNSFKGGIQPTHWMPLPAPPEPIVPEVPARVDGEGE